MLDRLRRLIPTREQIQRNRWLRWLGPRVLHPRLWSFSRRGVAVGVAVGIFFGLLIPVAQIPMAAGAAVVLRANLPVAVGSTLVTNPITFAPIYLLAHRLGVALLGPEEAKSTEAAPVQAAPDAAASDGSRKESLHRRLLGLGKPLLLGLGVIAVVAGVLTYALIMIAWRVKTLIAWRRRKRRINNKPSGSNQASSRG